MLTYTFSKREKIMLAVFGVLLIAIGWFELVYVRTTDQINTIEAQLQTTNASIEAAQTKVQRKQEMQQAIAKREAEGAKATPMPAYDNIRPLMTELDGIMARTDTYTLTFDELDFETTEYVLRGVGMQFGCGSYAAAEEIVGLIANGEFPCLIDSVSIVDSGNTNVRSDGSSVMANVHVLFYERPTDEQRAQALAKANANK